MLEIKNTEVFGIPRAILASHNPMSVGEINTKLDAYESISSSGFDRGKKLGSAPSGSGHDNFLKGIIVQFDVKYPQYWSMEAQRYHWFSIISSQSKMTRLAACVNNKDFYGMFNKYVDLDIIRHTEEYLIKYNTETDPDQKYFWFMKALSNLPMGYELWMTISTNYLQLKTIYQQRKNHKLREDWKPFCDWCEGLPNFCDLTGVKK